MNYRRYSVIILLLVLGCLAVSVAVRAQKVVSELTLVYDYSVNPTDDGKQSTAENAVHTIYIKGNRSRSEISNSMFSSTTIFDGNTGFGGDLAGRSADKSY